MDEATRYKQELADEITNSLSNFVDAEGNKFNDAQTQHVLARLTEIIERAYAAGEMMGRNIGYNDAMASMPPPNAAPPPAEEDEE